jgi:hypothetical protein
VSEIIQINFGGLKFMKKFALTVVGAAVFFTGLGAIVENAGAKGKSDERALELVRKARLAIGGDAAINGVQSMRIVGQTTRSIKLDGAERSEQGETEIALQFPDKLMKSVKIGSGDGTATFERRLDNHVIVMGDMKEKVRTPLPPPAPRADGAPVVNHRIVIKKDDGTTQELTGEEAAAFIAAHPAPPAGAHTVIVKKKADGTVERTEDGDVVVVRKADGGEPMPFTIRTRDGKGIQADNHNVIIERAGAAHGGDQNELFKLTLSLLMATPQGLEVTYTYAGEGNVDGDVCDIVNASLAGQSYKLYLSRASSLPVMVSFKGARAPQVFFRSAGAPVEGAAKEKVAFSRTIAAPPSGELAEYSVKFSNYRSTNGVNLPYKWTQTIGGAADEVFEVTSYELNPANIADKFKNQRVIVNELKPATK